MRPSGRRTDELRPVTLETGFNKYAEGSCLVRFGDTHVVCMATVEQRVPGWMRNTGRGWISAEYGMLPRATDTRSDREAARGKVGGRTMEIQRLIGRSIRAVIDMEALGERTVRLDCDVLQADGGTRTAAITGAWVAMALASRRLLGDGTLDRDPVRDGVAAVSTGIVGGQPLLDLDYKEDSGADVDMNVVMTAGGDFVEVQGTAEGAPFPKQVLETLTELAAAGIRELIEVQSRVLAGS